MGVVLKLRGFVLYFYKSRPPPGIFKLVTLPLEIPERKQAFSSPMMDGYSAKLCDTTWKFQFQKPAGPKKIPHEFFLNTPGNGSKVSMQQYW